MIDIYVIIWHLKNLIIKTILRPSIVGGMPSNALTCIPNLNTKCTRQGMIILKNTSLSWCTINL